ncbi:CrcB family protein [Arcanobacterium haemolyticum]|nr:CrcB family protein [Arcanobacterium haemolyticum]
MVWALVALAGGCGAVCRAALDSFVTTKHRFTWPAGIALVNVVGSFIFGAASVAILLSIHAMDTANLVVLTGFCGGFTTFSTAMLDVVRLFEERRIRAALALAVGTFVVSLVAYAAGAGVTYALMTE